MADRTTLVPLLTIGDDRRSVDRLADAAGRVAAETIAPYPPGIPAIAPGELLTTDLLDALRDEARAGSRMAGACDPTLETLLVVRA